MMTDLQGYRLCLFCLKDNTLTTSDETVIVNGQIGIKESKNVNGDLERLVKFLKLVHKFIGGCDEKNDNLATSLLFNSGSLNWVECCDECGVTVDSFCKVFHQFKCLELWLEWKLNQLVGVMKLANKVPSRIAKVLEQNLEGGSERACLDKIKNPIGGFRRHLVKKCNRRLGKSQPRILVDRSLLKSPQTHKNPNLRLTTQPANRETLLLLNIVTATADSPVASSTPPPPSFLSADQHNESNEIKGENSGVDALIDHDNYDDELPVSTFNHGHNQSAQESLVDIKFELPRDLFESPAEKKDKTSQPSPVFLHQPNIPLKRKLSECTVCSKNFKSEDFLKIHLRKVHMFPKNANKQIEQEQKNTKTKIRSTQALTPDGATPFLNSDIEHHHGCDQERDNVEKLSSLVSQQQSFREKRKLSFNIKENQNADVEFSPEDDPLSKSYLGSQASKQGEHDSGGNKKHKNAVQKRKRKKTKNNFPQIC